MALDEQVNIQLNVYASQSTKSIADMRNEMKLLNQAMTEAAATGNNTKFEELGKRMGELRNDMVDLKAKMKATDPGELLAGFTRMASGAVSSFAAISGAMATFGGESKEMQELQKKSASIIQLMMGLEQARMLLIDKGARAANLATLQGIANQGKLLASTVATTLGLGAMATAEVAVAGSTEMATVATWKWNAALLANPIGLIIAGVAALVGGIALLVYAMDDTTDSTEEFNAAMLSADALISTIDKNTKDYNDTLQESKDKYDLLTGAVTEYDLKLRESTTNRNLEIRNSLMLEKGVIAELKKEREIALKGYDEDSDEYARIAKGYQTKITEAQQAGNENRKKINEKYNYDDLAAKEAAQAEELKNIKKHKQDLIKNEIEYQNNLNNIRKTFNENYLLSLKNSQNIIDSIDDEEYIKSVENQIKILENAANTSENLIKINELKTKLLLKNEEKLYNERYKISKESNAQEVAMNSELALTKAVQDKIIQDKETELREKYRKENLTQQEIDNKISNDRLLNGLKDESEKNQKEIKDKYEKLSNITKVGVEKLVSESTQMYKNLEGLSAQDQLMSEKAIKKTLEEKIKVLYQEYGATAGVGAKLIDFETFKNNILLKIFAYHNKATTEILEQSEEDKERIRKNFQESEQLIILKANADYSNSIEDRRKLIDAQYKKDIENVKNTEAEKYAIKLQYQKDLEDLDDMEKERLQKKQELAIESARVIADGVATILQQQKDREYEIESNDRSKKYGLEAEYINKQLITQEEKDAKLAALKVKQDQEDLKARQKKFKYDQKMSIIMINIATALAIMQGFAQLGPVGGAFAAIGTGIAGAVQLAIVASQKPPSFAKGGLLSGPSHSGGGIMLEAEGGEVILNKNSMANPALRSIASSLNVAGGGVPIPGSTSSNGSGLLTSTIDNESVRMIVEEVVGKVKSIPVVNVETEYSRVQRRVTNYESNSQIG